jgi:hypothetical protein
LTSFLDPELAPPSYDDLLALARNLAACAPHGDDEPPYSSLISLAGDAEALLDAAPAGRQP